MLVSGGADDEVLLLASGGGAVEVTLTSRGALSVGSAAAAVAASRPDGNRGRETPSRCCRGSMLMPPPSLSSGAE